MNIFLSQKYFWDEKIACCLLWFVQSWPFAFTWGQSGAKDKDSICRGFEYKGVCTEGFCLGPALAR